MQKIISLVFLDLQLVFPLFVSEAGASYQIRKGILLSRFKSKIKIYFFKKKKVL